MIYDILWETKIVGSAQVIRKGLYYEIRCRDSVVVPHTVALCCGDERIDLGICVPIDKEFGFNTRIPVKRIGEGNLSFRLIPVSMETNYYTVREDKPFPCVSRLKDAYLVREKDALLVAFKSEAQDR